MYNLRASATLAFPSNVNDATAPIALIATSTGRVLCCFFKLTIASSAASNLPLM